MKNFLKNCSDYIIFRLFTSFLFLARVIGIKNSSNFFAKILAFVGPLTKTGWIVRNNLRFVGIEDAKLDKLEKKIWENFGRYIGELAFVEEEFLASAVNITVKSAEIIEKLQAENTKFIVFSGHFANWDYILYSLLNITGGAGVVYRKVNNKFIDKYIRKMRSFKNVAMIEKGPYGAKDLIKLVKQSRNMLMLVDQKMNEGINVPFLGKAANSPPAAAVIARQFQYALVPLRIKRVRQHDFEIEFQEAFFVDNTSDKERDVYVAVERINNILSSWILDRPEDWFWMHQRWGKPHEMQYSRKK